MYHHTFIQKTRFWTWIVHGLLDLRDGLADITLMGRFRYIISAILLLLNFQEFVNFFLTWFLSDYIASALSPSLGQRTGVVSR